MSSLAVLCALSSCAGVKPKASADDLASDSAPLLDAAETKVGATDLNDSAVFADLNAGKADPGKVETPAATTEGDTYYSAFGGESLRRVAFTLYRNHALVGKLLEKNPELKGVKHLAAGQKVFFDMGTVRPEPRYLTKDLLNRYAQALAERLAVAERKLPETSVTLNKGESLQELSHRLYGTNRYWPEIYLANHDKIPNYDRVPAGLSLRVVSREENGVAKAEAPVPMVGASTDLLKPEPVAPVPKKVEAVKPAPVVAPLPIQPAPVVAIQPSPVPVAAPVMKDPIPEIPPVADKALPSPAPVKSVSKKVKPTPVAVEDIVENTGSANASLRRILYVLLTLAIGGGAYYFTRTPKRPGVDMLDVNTEATARPKLAPKDSQQSQIG